MDIPILYEDAWLFAINKPPGIVVNRAQSVREETVQDWAEKRVEGGEEKDFSDRSGIVHRIDKETSGILLIAKTPHVFRELQRQFKDREVKKTYLAVVHGALVPPEGEIRAPVGRLPWNRERFGIVPGGREAVTRYARISLVQRPMIHETLTVVALFPESGRTHQIRVHLKYIGHPVVGDPLYAGRKTSRRDRRGAAPRVMLHAWKLSFAHPVTRRALAIEAPIPDDMERLLKLENGKR